MTTLTSTATQNAAVARRIYQAFSEDRFDDVLAEATEDVEVILHAFGQTFHGHDGFRDFMAGFKAGFSDLRITVADQVADETHVCTEFTARGTHDGPLATPAGSIPATGRTVDLDVCEVLMFRDGRVSSLRNYQDSGRLMAQLGLTG